MTFTLAFGGYPQDLTITLSGNVDRFGLHRLNAHLQAHPEFRKGLLILVDVSELNTADLTDETLADAASLVVERDWRAQPLGIAIVAPDPETFAAAAHYRAHLGGSRSRRSVFTNHAEAVAWLREQRGASR